MSAGVADGFEANGLLMQLAEQSTSRLSATRLGFQRLRMVASTGIGMDREDEQLFKAQNRQGFFA